MWRNGRGGVGLWLNAAFVSPEEEEGEDGGSETDEGDGDTDDPDDPQGECLS